MEKCDIGKSLNIDCHKTGFSRKQGFVQFKDLPCEKQEEIIWRANLKEKYSSIRIICCYHEQFYGIKNILREKLQSVAILLEHTRKVKKLL